MVNGCVNDKDASGHFVADKSKVIGRALAWLGSNVTTPAARKVLGLWSAARKGAVFADTDNTVALEALDAMVSGKDKDAYLAKVAQRMARGAMAGERTNGTTVDDGPGITQRTAEFLAAKPAGEKAAQ